MHGEHLTRHSGIEYGSSTLHRFTNNGGVPVEAIWFVHGRNHTGY